MAISCQTLKDASLIVLAGLCVCFVDSAVAGQRRAISQEEVAARRTAIQAIVAKITEAQRVLDEANVSADGAPADSRSQTSRKKLRGIEEELLANVSGESDLSKARTELARRQDEFELQTQRVLGSPEYMDRLKKVENASNAAELRATIRKDALDNDSTYKTARWEYRYAKKRFESLKTETFSLNNEWASAVSAVRQDEVRPKVSKDTVNATSVASDKDAQSSEDPVVAAQVTIVEGKNLLRQMGIKNVNGFLQEHKKSP